MLFLSFGFSKVLLFWPNLAGIQKRHPNFHFLKQSNLLHRVTFAVAGCLAILSSNCYPEKLNGFPEKWRKSERQVERKKEKRRGEC